MLIFCVSFVLKKFLSLCLKYCLVAYLFFLLQKAVLSVLTEACRVKVPHNPEKPRKERNAISISEAILKKCRIALRSAISSDESKLFGNLLGTTLVNSNENEDEGILGFPGMVSRPLDFRTIDIRLAMGAYYGSWEAFLEDVQEVCFTLTFIILFNYDAHDIFCNIFHVCFANVDPMNSVCTVVTTWNSS